MLSIRPLETTSGFDSYSSAASVDIGFKIRKNHSWDYADRGGDFSVFGVPFQVIQGGNNIVLPADGTYIVTYDPSAETITVVQAE